MYGYGYSAMYVTTIHTVSHGTRFLVQFYNIEVPSKTITSTGYVILWVTAMIPSVLLYTLITGSKYKVFTMAIYTRGWLGYIYDI